MQAPRDAEFMFYSGMVRPRTDAGTTVPVTGPTPNSQRLKVALVGNRGESEAGACGPLRGKYRGTFFDIGFADFLNVTSKAKAKKSR